MPIVPLFGVGVKGRSSNVTSQRRINLYAEWPKDSDKSEMVLYSRPGLYPEYFTDNETSFGAEPIRSLIVGQTVADAGLPSHRVVEFVLGAAGSDAILSLDGDTFLATAGVFQTAAGAVTFADNGRTIMGVDGVGVYVSNYFAGSLALTDESATIVDFPLGATSICAIAGRFVVNDQTNKGRFRWSDALDYTTWDGLNFATAESIPDPLVAVYAWRGELLLFGTNSIEFWAPTDVGFQRTQGSGAEWGLAAQETIRDVDGQLFFLARNAGSDAKVVALNGYQPQQVSDPDVEYDINKSGGSGVSACVVRKSGATFYVLNLPSKTWAYNATSGVWDEWQTDDGRFAGQISFYAYGRQMMTDYRNSSVYGIDADAYVDGDSPMVRQLDTRHVFHDMDRLTVWELRLDVETGVGLIEGQGSDPQIMLQVSRDNGHTFGSELWKSLGAMGEYKKPVVWRALGRARDFVLRFKVADPVKVVLIGASMRIE